MADRHEFFRQRPEPLFQEVLRRNAPVHLMRVLKHLAALGAQHFLHRQIRMLKRNKGVSPRDDIDLFKVPASNRVLRYVHQNTTGVAMTIPAHPQHP